MASPALIRYSSFVGTKRGEKGSTRGGGKCGETTIWRINVTVIIIHSIYLKRERRKMQRQMRVIYHQQIIHGQLERFVLFGIVQGLNMVVIYTVCDSFPFRLFYSGFLSFKFIYCFFFILCCSLSRVSIFNVIVSTFVFLLLSFYFLFALLLFCISLLLLYFFRNVILFLSMFSHFLS